ncbi:MAG: TIGR00270 family protein [Candidatus Thermoplasmatota archaeon]|nr:TIGR00270 family protein [Candidatus Thermoplasmatota archaeon]
MNCELCGKEISQGTTVSIENSEITVCEECKSYGKEVFSSDTEDVSDNEILQRIKNKKRSSSSSDIYRGDQKELALDYSERIEEARMKKDLTQEELAKKISEKKSVIAKLEREEMRPSDDLRDKLENSLDIELMEKIEKTSTKKSEESEGLTIGDLIEEES